MTRSFFNHFSLLPALMVMTWIFLTGFSLASSDLTAKIQTDAQRRSKSCGKCPFFALPYQESWTKNARIFFVSTTEKMPPIRYIYAVGPNGDLFSLKDRPTHFWNRLAMGPMPQNVLAERFTQIALPDETFVGNLPSSDTKTFVFVTKTMKGKFWRYELYMAADGKLEIRTKEEISRKKALSLRLQNG